MSESYFFWYPRPKFLIPLELVDGDARVSAQNPGNAGLIGKILWIKDLARPVTRRAVDRRVGLILRSSKFAFDQLLGGLPGWIRWAYLDLAPFEILSKGCSSQEMKKTLRRAVEKNWSARGDNLS